MKNYDITIIGNGLISKLIVVATSNLNFKVCRVLAKSFRNTQNQIYSIREDSYNYLSSVNLFRGNPFFDIEKMSLFLVMPKSLF